MAIDMGQETFDIVKRLTSIRMERDLRTKELVVYIEYSTGYDRLSDGRFVQLERSGTSFLPLQSKWIMQRKPSQGNLTDPTLAEFLVTLFDGIESGQIVVPTEEELRT